MTRWRWLIPIVGCWLVGFAQAAEIQDVEASHESGRYRLAFSMQAKVSASYIRQVLLSPKRVQQLSQAIQYIELLPAHPDGATRFREQVHACSLLYCVDYRNVMQLRELANGEIQLTVEPELSDFSYGELRWQIEPLSEHASQLELRVENQPNFWVPPLVGVHLIAGRMAELTRDMLHQIECEYRQRTDCQQAYYEAELIDDPF